MIVKRIINAVKNDIKEVVIDPIAEQEPSEIVANSAVVILIFGGLYLSLWLFA